MADDGATQPGTSKTAKKKAAKKAAGEGSEPAAAPPPAPAPKAEPKAKASAKAEPKAEPKAKASAKAAAAPAAAVPAPAVAEPKAKAKAKAKAEPKAEQPKAEPKAEPKAAQPKAKAKAKAVAEPPAPPPKAEPAPAPPPAAKAKSKAEGKASSKAAGKASAKAKAEPKPVEEPPKKEEPPTYLEFDDGTGGDWETATGMTKKQQRRKERADEADAETKAAGPRAQQYIPGMAPAPDPKAKAKAGAKFDPNAAAMAGAAAAAAAIASANKAAADALAANAPDPTASMVTIKVPENKIGIVIGPKGSKIKLIQEKTGVNRIDTSGEIFTITGPAQAVALAEAAIKQLIEKGYTALAFEDFKEDFVSVHPNFFPDIIGKQGSVIRKIKEELSVEVGIPEVPKSSSTKKHKVSVAGPGAAVEKAKKVIEDIMMYGHSEVTHPGIVHEELEVAEWLYRFLIGKAGSEMRHIQNNFKVKVNIPRETSLNHNVVVVGDRIDVDRAKTYIEKVLWNAEHAPRGRDKVDEGDVWGEEEEEDWMKPFLYKR